MLGFQLCSGTTNGSPKTRFPEKFSNKTNGITFRRWLMVANPALSAFISRHIGDGWRQNADAMLTRLLDQTPVPVEETWSVRP